MTVFFHVEAPSDGTGVSVNFKVLAEQPDQFLPNIQQENLFRSPDDTVLFTGIMSPHDGFVYAGKITGKLDSVSKMFKANFLPDLIPFGIAANDD